ncbi:DUF6049 family protein [Promicromonospora iranensis]|uniref:Secreted protein n=1 Tax=Promicromonospora iranensis TaxID=1105144 RepID=A0ABU2CPS0_9MICO|nr:DUF6049 family protein [Promicromonospora iranensis]MDR7383319.1 hypothetical protein [Promicromonospora iranensis]
MTQHPDLSRSSVPRRAAHRTGTIGAVLLATVLLVGPAIVPAAATVPATATVPTSVPASNGVPAAPSDQGTLDVSITEISHPTAVQGDEVTVRARITNGTGTVVSGANASMTVDFAALTTRSQVAEWASADLLDPTRGNPTTKPVGRLAPGASKNVSFTYDPGAAVLQGFGPRRLAISVDDVTGRLGIARSFLLYDAEDAGYPERVPMQLSILAGITGPATDPADQSTTDIELAQLAAAGQRLDGVVEVAERSTLSLAVDPAVMAVAAASNDSALTAWSERLLAAAEDTTTYTLPDRDPDLAALAHANVRTTGSRSFLHAPRPGNWPIPESWRPGLAWPADGVVPDLETLGLAVAAGRTNVLVSRGLGEQTGTATGRADVATPSGTAHAAVTDPMLTRALLSATDLSQADAATTESATDTDSASTASTTAEGTQRLLAETAAVVSQSQGESPTMSVVMPRTWTPDAEAATTILKELDKADWVQTTTLDEVFAQDAPDVVREPLPNRHVAKAELSAGKVAALERARDAAVTFSSVAVDNPGPLWRPVVARLAVPLAVAQRADPGIRNQLVRRGLDATDELTQESVTVVPRQDINFITDVGNIPVRVRNTLGVDATVTVVLRPDHPRLTVDDRVTETVPAGQELDVQVPVRAIGSGDVDVTAQILTPTGAKITDGSSFQVRVRAGWEEVGTWIAAGLVALLFLAGIWRTVRRGRSPYRATREDIEEATGASAEAPEAMSTPVTDSVGVRAE